MTALNQKINKLERALIIAYMIAYVDYCSTFEEHLEKDGSVTIHQHNCKVLAIAMYKKCNGLSPTFMVEMIIELDTCFFISIVFFNLRLEYA